MPVAWARVYGAVALISLGYVLQSNKKTTTDFEPSANVSIGKKTVVSMLGLCSWYALLCLWSASQFEQYESAKRHPK